MIFVTVGTYKCDTLIRKIDNISKTLEDKIVAQIGEGVYEPKNCYFFRFAPSLTKYCEKADLIIASGGVGTIFELLSQRAKFIGVSNDSIPDHHQNEILEKLAFEGYLYWCRDTNRISACIKKAKTFEFKPYFPPVCKIDKVIEKYLRKCI